MANSAPDQKIPNAGRRFSDSSESILEILNALPALVGVGGIWIASFFWQLNRLPLLPPHDPLLAEVSLHE